MPVLECVPNISEARRAVVLEACASAVTAAGATQTLTSHGPRVIPPGEQYDTARYGDRPLEAGLSPDTAVAVVENASLASRRRFHGTLADLPSLESRTDLNGPVMTVIGDAVAGANFEHSEPLAAHRKQAARAEPQGARI